MGIQSTLAFNWLIPANPRQARAGNPFHSIRNHSVKTFWLAASGVADGLTEALAPRRAVSFRASGMGRLPARRSPDRCGIQRYVHRAS